MRSADKERLIVEVTRRVLERTVQRAETSPEAYLDNLIHEVLYFETRRLESDKTSTTIEADRRWLSNLKDRGKNASERDKKAILEEIIHRHVNEVVGNFSRTTYEFSTRILPGALGVMLNGMSPLKLARQFPRMPDVSKNIVIQGEIDQALALSKRGTLVLAPTHSSNLDSPAVGYSIYKMGLPPVSYGAGLNLFRNKFFSFFMNRLGAYKVDRMKKHGLYKEVLKEYATATLEMGYDNLFFPGGTRSRSGEVERKLKLGLLGCGLNAYYNNLKSGKHNPNIYVIPCTINYQLVLEGETLIEDHLKEAGKSRYIIEDDEFSRLDRLYSFMKSLVTLDASVFLHFGRALDPFGNPVDDEGRSMDLRGRTIDPSRYLCRDGRLVADANRDVVYTRELGNRLSESFMRYNVICSTHLVARTVFDMLRREHPDPDFYRFLRQTAYDASLPMVDIYRAVEASLERAKRFESNGSFLLSDTLKSKPSEAVVNQAMKLFGCYHTKPVLVRRGDRLFPEDMNLLFYYSNRLAGYGFSKIGRRFA